MNLLLHICCAPCSVYCIESLRGEGIAPTGFWYNPNIHPYQEYKMRRDTLLDYAPAIGLPLYVREEYGLQPFVKAVAGDIAHRCRYCYAVRMEETARFAAEHGFTHIGTTLLVSPYQDHEGIRQAGEAAAARHGVSFLYRDFSVGFRVGQEKARALGLYRQKYCGCVFSEEERYEKQIRRDRERFDPERPLFQGTRPGGDEEIGQGGAR